MSRTLTVFTACLILFIVSGRPMAVSQVRYRPVQLPTPAASTGSNGRALNDYGQVVGSYTNKAGFSRAYLWTPSVPNGATGVAVDLGTLPGYATSIPSAMNASGQVAGTCRNTYTDGRAFLWTPSTPNGSTGTMIDLGLPAGTQPEVQAINKWGQIVGFLHMPDGTSHAFLWDPVNGGQDLNNRAAVIAGGWDLTSANGINADGQIAGSGKQNGLGYAYLYDTQTDVIQRIEGDWVVLYSYSNIYSGASGLNEALYDAGGTLIRPVQVIGYAMNAAGQQHAFLWDSWSGMRDLGTLGGTSSRTVAVNNAGQVVGQSSNTRGRTRGFVWQDGVMWALDQLASSSDLIEAMDINNSGQILMKGIVSGKNRAFLLFPQ